MSAYRHLTHDLRCQIYTLKASGMSQTDVAEQIGVHKSTVCRELKRNLGKRGYRYKQADQKARDRRRSASARPKRMTQEAKDFIKKQLTELQSSPQQISGRMKTLGMRHVSHESIYRMILKDKKDGGDLYTHLRRRGKKYNRRLGKTAGRGCIPHRTDIDERPKEADEKKRFGDFELDTIVGANHKGAIVSMVDRASKITKLMLIAAAKAVLTTAALVDSLKEFTEKLRTLTADNGKEFAGHLDVTEQLGVKVYFAKPYHSWQRGLNEHTNGLVRQYFPKGTDFTQLTQQQVKHVEDVLNNRPRKALNFLTPYEMLDKLIG